MAAGLVQLVYNFSRGRLDEVDAIVGIHVAVLTDVRSPIGGHGSQLDIGRQLGSNRYPLPRGVRRDPFPGDIFPDMSALLRLKADACSSWTDSHGLSESRRGKDKQ